jgi:dephospho-CoA kinase
VALRVFGLTGGIGSGKSAAAARLRARGLPVVNADELARVAVVPGSETLAQLVEYFGPGILKLDGELDRPKLGGIVFSDPEARRALDRMVHPTVRALASERFAALAERGEPLACYEVPLLYESGLEKTYSPVVVVNAPDAQRKPRLAARDGLDSRQVEARIAAQMPLPEKVRRAEYVIENDATLAELERRADAVFDALCHSLAIDPARYPRPLAN